MKHKLPSSRRYAVREVPWLAGSRRRLIGHCRYYHEATRLAENLSLERRQIIVECGHRQLDVWVNGQRQG